MAAKCRWVGAGVAASRLRGRASTENGGDGKGRGGRVTNATYRTGLTQGLVGTGRSCVPPRDEARGKTDGPERPRSAKISICLCRVRIPVFEPNTSRCTPMEYTGLRAARTDSQYRTPVRGTSTRGRGAADEASPRRDDTHDDARRTKHLSSPGPAPASRSSHRWILSRHDHLHAAS